MENGNGAWRALQGILAQHPLKTGCAVLSAVFLLVELALPVLILSGDEPRYVFKGLSFLYTGNPTSDLSIANEWLKRFGYPPLPPAANDKTQSFIHTALLSPILHFFGVEAGRWTQVLLTAIALSLLASLHWADSNPRSRVLALALTLLSPMCLFYSALMYPDIWIAGLFAMSLFFLYKSPLSARSAAVSIGLAVAIPFFHIRGAPIALICGLFVAWKVFAEQRDLLATARFLTPSIIVGLVGLVLFVWHQYGLFGGLANSATAAVMPSVRTLPMQLDAHLLGYRHGLLTYFPATALAFFGLLLGAKQRNAVALQALAVLVLYFSFTIWGSASESYSTRFWTAILPCFFIGFAIWFQSLSRLKMVISILFALLQIGFILRMIEDPSSFLANRFLALPLMHIAPDLWSSFDMQSILSFELYELRERAPFRTASTSAARLLLLALVLGGLLFAAHTTRNSTRWIAGSLSVALALAILGMARLTEVTVTSAQTAAFDASSGTYATSITLSRAEPLRVIYVGDPNNYAIWEFPQTGVRDIVLEGFAPNGDRLFSVAAEPGFAFYVPDRKFVSKVTFTYIAAGPFPDTTIRAFR